ncbi:STAS domain-containing protein [Guptibacillus hwajinpoensis]|uniref:STAS domain-containing protein n=1 Tax=Guptibacillus hwajinpoensis TaxID=208199 RepID=UPI001CFC98BE|nr:STAS domain-containing protein [Pseudalkalibacillus hwajinpoensis]WLR58781.1 STAS domain-containing protein [Pseudalkalibacillus hwajinpoensis]
MKGGREPLIIDDLAAHDSTKDMEVTKDLGGGSLIGVPIYYRNGDNYGTLCGLDLKPFHYTQDHVDLFKAMANLLGNVLELERANTEIESLSVPIVPISEEVAILPIIGDVNEIRTERLMERALAESAKNNLDYLIFDLSGLVKIHSQSATNLLKIGDSLKLVGVQMIVTGIRPDLAIKAVQASSDFDQIVVKSNLQQALHWIGYSLIKT